MRGAIAWILRIFSYLYHLGVALFLFALGMIALLSGDDHTLNFVMLPWEGDKLVYALLGLGFVGILSAVLALTGKTRAVLMVTALVFLALLFRGLYFSPLRFDTGFITWQSANYLSLAAVIAVIGAFLKPHSQRTRG